MDMRLVSNPDGLQKINAALSYLDDLHNGRRTHKPEVSDEYMAEALQLWLNRRKQILSGIKSSFSELEKARANGCSTVDIILGLTSRIEAYNGVFLPDMAMSFEAATGVTPLEGWLCKSPPQSWRLAKKTRAVMVPVDYEGLFYSRPPSTYLTMTEGLFSVTQNPSIFLLGSTFCATAMSVSLFLVEWQALGSLSILTALVNVLATGLVFFFLHAAGQDHQRAIAKGS